MPRVPDWSGKTVARAMDDSQRAGWTFRVRERGAGDFRDPVQQDHPEPVIENSDVSPAGADLPPGSTAAVIVARRIIPPLPPREPEVRPT